MATYGKVDQVSRLASGDLSDSRWHIVAWAGSRKVALATAAATTFDAGPMGVLQEVADGAGKSVSVGVEGPSKVVAGSAAITEGKLLTCNTSGRAIHATSGDIVIGQAMESAVAHDVFQVYLNRPFRLVGAN